MAPAAGQEDPPPVAAAQTQDDQASDGAGASQQEQPTEGDQDPAASTDQGDGSAAGEDRSGSSGGDPDEGPGQGGASPPPWPAGSSSYGGRATGPAPLQTLPDDPAYPVPGPPKSRGLPEKIDVAPAWQPNLVCDPVDRPGLEAFGVLVGGHYGRPGFTTSRPCIAQRSEHYDGRAVDWQLNAYHPHDRRIGDAVVSWLTADDGEMARRFGLQSIIWNQRVWHNDGRGWQHYVGQSPHTDHVHFSFTWDGAMMRTSWWTGVAVVEPDLGPCPGASGQPAASPRAPRYEPCPPAGLAASEAARAVAYAEHQRTPYTRHKRLRLAEGDRGPAVERLQQALGLETDGVFGPVTAEAVAELTAAHPLLLESEEVSTLAWHLLELRDHPTLPYRDIALEHGDRGAAVAVLQRVLGVEADGIFGPITEQAVREVQQEADLETTGVVDPDTWIAMEKAAPLVSAIAGDEESDGPGPSRVRDQV
ncbi:peptidoglycan-binding domain-containing protein [Ornithinicoccus halotolerans]|uniref:peptidoglycan-binding domain-containing protein n=1 Tax=Ornithinicoccus halotolerans TaxID=1748220 RepID=UPI00129713EC|nr:peptidoglycan-binding protein [Ornithinicoccus halotolerans]